MGNQSQQQPQRLTTKDIEKLFEDLRPGLAQVLPANMSIERYERIFISEIKKNPPLLECTKKSIGAAAMKGAVYGMETGVLGRCYLNAYNKKVKASQGQPEHYVKEMEFVIGYKGLLDMAYKSGEIVSIAAEEVKEKDHFVFMKGLHENLEHMQAMGNRGETIAYYSYARLKSGGFKFEVMSREEMMAHALQYSKQQYKGKLSGAWGTSFDGMAKKTMLVELLKYLPQTIEIRRDAQETGDLSEYVDIETEPEPAAEPQQGAEPVTPESDPREYLKQYQEQLKWEREQQRRKEERQRRKGIV